eukprot:199563-Pelagomonas_calceolata.AAC.1
MHTPASWICVIRGWGSWAPQPPYSLFPCLPSPQRDAAASGRTRTSRNSKNQELTKCRALKCTMPAASSEVKLLHQGICMRTV